MKKVLVFIILGIFSMLVVGGCSSSVSAPDDVVVDGQQMTATYESNASTGYSWAYAVDNQKVLSFISEEYLQPEGGEAGAAGEQSYVFKGVKEGTAKITFTYLRPWESDQIAETKVLTVSVDTKGNITSVTEE